MFKVNNKDFTLLTKYKVFIMDLDNLIENIPRKDYFYKDRIRLVSNNLLEYILITNYSKTNIDYLSSHIKGLISELDFLLDRLFSLKYINDKNLYKIGIKLIEINKITCGWLKSKYES